MNILIYIVAAVALAGGVIVGIVKTRPAEPKAPVAKVVVQVPAEKPATVVVAPNTVQQPPVVNTPATVPAPSTQGAVKQSAPQGGTPAVATKPTTVTIPAVKPAPVAPAPVTVKPPAVPIAPAPTPKPITTPVPVVPAPTPIVTTPAPVAPVQPSIKVVINGAQLTETQIADFESRYGKKPDTGTYWYDSRSGLYGAVGYQAYGFMYPGHSYGRMSSGASGGNTEVFINGREIPQDEWLVWSALIGSPLLAGRYWLDASGNAGYEGIDIPVVNLYASAAQTGGGGGGGGDNFWSTRFSAGNSNADNSQGYVSVPGVGPVGYGF